MAAHSCDLLQDNTYHQEILRKNQEAIQGLSWENVALKVLGYYKSLLV